MAEDCGGEMIVKCLNPNSLLNARCEDCSYEPKVAGGIPVEWIYKIDIEGTSITYLCEKCARELVIKLQEEIWTL